MSLHVLPAGIVSAAYSTSSYTTQSGIGAATFDGSDELKRNAPGLSGHSDGKEWTFSFWFNMGDSDSDQDVFWTIRSGSSNKFIFQRSEPGGTALNKLTLVGRNASGTTIMVMTSSSAYTSNINAGWNHVMCSGDMTNTSRRHMYVNGTDVLDAVATHTNDNIDFTGTFEIGGSDEITGLGFDGEMAELWLDDSYIDLSSSTNRQKFYTSGSRAADVGSDGSTPTGSSPLMYLHLDAGETGNNFASNAGTGGDFSVSVGALVNAGGLDFYIPGAATFDGNDELKRDAPGVFSSDGKQWAFSFWFNLADSDDNVQVFFQSYSSANKFLLQRSPVGGAQDNNLALVGRDASGNLNLYVESLLNANGQFDSTSRSTGWNHVLCSGNLATSTAHLYANGVSILDTTSDHYVNSDIDFTGDFYIGGTSLYSEIAEFWLDDSYIDFSSSTNREKFRSSGGAAVDVGSDGSTPTGSAPLVYLHLDSFETGNNFASNAGTGGDLSVIAGALTNAGGLD